MIEKTKHEAGSHMVVVVGVDLSDVSEHLLARARDLACRVDQGELHVVHVIPNPVRLRVEPMQPIGLDPPAQAELVRRELERLCEASAPASRPRVIIHTPIGRAADELTRIAREVNADVIVVEVYNHAGLRRVFHHSVVARIVRAAPCSVLAIRDPKRVAPPSRTSRPDVIARAAPTATAR